MSRGYEATGDSSVNLHIFDVTRFTRILDFATIRDGSKIGRNRQQDTECLSSIRSKPMQFRVF